MLQPYYTNADLLYFALTLYIHSDNNRQHHCLLVVNTISKCLLIRQGSLDKTLDLVLSFSFCTAASRGNSQVGHPGEISPCILS